LIYRPGPLDSEESFESRTGGLKRGARDGTALLRAAGLAVDGSHLMRQYRAFDGKSRGNGNFEIITSALAAAAVRRDCAHDGESQGCIERVHRDDEDGPLPLLLVASRAVHIDVNDVSFADDHLQDFPAAWRSPFDRGLLRLAQRLEQRLVREGGRILMPLDNETVAVEAEFDLGTCRDAHPLGDCGGDSKSEAIAPFQDILRHERDPVHVYT
jgi:hypothetical protein